jgi:hypothetical protein
MNRGIGYSSLIEQLIEQQYQEERLDQAPDNWEALVPENSVIKTSVEERNGLHVVYLNIIDMEDPTCFVRTPARVCRSRHTAEVIASYKCRLCACDTCIPINIDMEDFRFSDN